MPKLETISGNADPILIRRNLIVGAPNSRRRLEYVVTLEGDCSPETLGFLRVRVRYIPDRQIIQPESYDTYLAYLERHEAPGVPAWTTLEASAADILDDFNNEIVPKWIQVTVVQKRSENSTGNHTVMLEDRQPKWDNSALLDRVDRN